MTYTRLGSLIILKKNSKILKIPKSVDLVIRQTAGCSGKYRLCQYEKIWTGPKIKISDLPLWCKLKKDEILHKQNKLRYVVNWSKTYFNPRYAEQRKSMAKTFKGGKLLVLFAGVGPIACTLSKNYQHIHCVEWNKIAVSLAATNFKLNKISNVTIECCDAYQYVKNIHYGLYEDCITFSPTCQDLIVGLLAKKVSRLVHYKIVKDDQLKKTLKNFLKFGRVKCRRAKEYCKNFGIYQFIINFNNAINFLN